jgi:hypothetical protein
MNNEPVAWKVIETDDEGSFTTFTEVEPVWADNAIPLYTHPAKTLKDREADRKRFSDEAFNRWLDESISDSGHTVYDLVENVCEAWHGWENSQYYKPAKTLLTDEEIKERFFEFCQSSGTWRDFKRAILRKAQEK